MKRLFYPACIFLICAMVGGCKLPDWIPGDVSRSDTQHENDAIDMAGAVTRYKGRDTGDPSKLPVVVRLKSAHVSGPFLMIDHESPPWGEVKASNGKILTGMCAILWERDGKFYGGHFEHIGKGSKARPIANIDKNILGAKPAKGQKIYAYLVDNNNKQRSNVVDAGTWK